MVAEYLFSTEMFGDIQAIAYDLSLAEIRQRKAGATGKLKSLHLLMSLRKLNKGVYINSNLPHLSQVTVQGFNNKSYSYQLYSLPFYLISQLHRLLEES